MAFRFRSAILLSVLFAGSVALAPAQEREPQTIIDNLLIAARTTAHPVLEKGGYFVREDHWTGVVSPKEPRAIRTQLYKGNEYGFWLAVERERLGDAKLLMGVYDAKGNSIPVKIVAEDDGVLGLLVAPPRTGLYTIAFWVKGKTKAKADEALLAALFTAYR